MSSKVYIVPTNVESPRFNSWDDLFDANVDDITTPLERLKTVMQNYTAKIDIPDIDFSLSRNIVRSSDSIINITQSIGRMDRRGTANTIPININRYIPD